MVGHADAQLAVVPVLQAELRRAEHVEAPQVILQLCFQRHGLVALSFPAAIAAERLREGEVFVLPLHHHAVHHGIVLPPRAGLPAQEAGREGHTQAVVPSQQCRTDGVGHPEHSVAREVDIL